MGIKTGRDNFKKFKAIISFLSFFSGFIPSFFHKLIWNFIKPFSSNLVSLIRYLVLKKLIGDLGDNVNIGANVTIKNWNGLSFGHNVSIHENCYLDAFGGIAIGDNVSIAHNTTLLSSTHTYSDLETPIKYNPIIKCPLEIKDDVWLGCGVRVLGGLVINRRNIIAAGAVLNISTFEGSIYGGVPAKKIKNI